MAADTIRHRWTCSGRVADRVGIKQQIIEYALQAGNELLAERGLFPHPACTQPLPRQGMLLKTFGVDGVGKDASELSFDGPIAIDGSCFPHPCRDLWRAGWAVLQFDQEGHVVKGIAGNVPAELPQTSVSGEYCAAAAFLEKSPHRGAVALSDCANVIRDWHKLSLQQRLSPSKVTGGIWKHVLAFSASPLTHEFQKVKAHQSSNGSFAHLPAEDRPAAQANDHADAHAKNAALELHPPLQSQDQARQQWDRATEVAIALATMATRWEQEPKLPRLPAPPRPPPTPAAASASSSTSAVHVFHQKILEHNRCLPKPHKLVSTEGLLWCRFCGSFGESRAVNLLKPTGCTGLPTSSGQRSRLKLLLAGRHPRTGEQLRAVSWDW